MDFVVVDVETANADLLKLLKSVSRDLRLYPLAETWESLINPGIASIHSTYQSTA